MTWTPVQDDVSTMGTSTSCTPTFTNPVVVGHLLVMLVFHNDASASSFTVTDATNTWTPMFTATYNSGVGATLAAWAAIAAGTANNTVTLSGYNADASAGDLVLTEWSGVTAPVTEDGTAQSATPTVATVVTPSYTPGVTGSLVINMVGTADAVSDMGTPWTNGDSYDYTAGVNSGDGAGAMTRTGAGWGWDTGALSAITPNAVLHTGSAFACLSWVFGIQAVGSGGGGPDLNIYRIN